MQAFHRYGVTGGGTDVTLDIPWRRPGASTGIDERLCADMIDECQRRGAQRLSQAFALTQRLIALADSGRAERRLSGAIHGVDVRLTGRIPTLPRVGPA